MLISVIRALPLGRKFLYLVVNFFIKRIGLIYTVKTRFSFQVFCNTRDFIQRAIFNFKFWEPDVSFAIKQMLRPGDIFVDVGANIGYYSLLAASLIGPEGEVISLEAHPKIFSLLEKNIKLNGFTNIHPFNVAVGRHEGSIEMFTGSDDSLGESTTLKRRGFKSIGSIDCKPLTSIISDNQFKRISVIKIDIEGAESQVLSDIIDNLALFDKNLKIVSEISVDTEGRTKLFNSFTNKGFKAYAVNNNYDEDYYISWSKPHLPVEISSIPEEQCDIIFSRVELKGVFQSC